MGILKTMWQSARHLFQIMTGYGRQPPSGEHEAAAAVFLPLLGMAIGFLGALAVVLMQAVDLAELSALAGVAVLAALGGARQIDAMMDQRRKGNGFPGGVVLFAAGSLYFLVAGLNRLGNLHGLEMMCDALLYLPVAGALAMVSTACVMPEPEAPMPLSSIKGLHMVLCAALSLVLMLPSFGVSSLAFVAGAVLTGAATGLVAGREEYRPKLLYTAAAVSELVFLFLLLLANRPPIFY